MEVCKICRASSVAIGVKRGKHSSRDYHLRRCNDCGFAWVSDPDRDYARIYGEDYYCGRGADALVDYVGELEHPDSSLRQFEWQGILEVVKGLAPITARTTWLDFGCGNGGLVRFLNDRAVCAASGYETGWIAEKAREHGIAVLDEARLAGRRFDIVTAIEVLEHVEDPVATLERIRSLLEPGGIFFFTTGNAAPFRQKLLEWSYVIPEIHISFFTPLALKRAMASAGLEAKDVTFNAGFAQIYAFKVLKNLGLKKLSSWQRRMPWSIISAVLERKFKLQDFPIGYARSS